MREINERELMFVYKRMDNYTFPDFVELFRFLWNFYKRREDLKEIGVYDFYITIDDGVPFLVLNFANIHDEGKIYLFVTANRVYIGGCDGVYVEKLDFDEVLGALWTLIFMGKCGRRRKNSEKEGSEDE